MDVDQLFADGPHLGGGGWTAIDPSAALALLVDGPAHEQGVAAVKAGGVQPAVQGCGAVELGGDLGPAGTLPDGGGICPRTGDQLDRVDEDRLAGTGFAREDGEAARQVEIELFDDDEVAQDDAFECHAQATPSFQCSLRRSVSK